MIASRKYESYLQSEHWKQVRAAVLGRSRYCCERCGITQTTAKWLYATDLHVHHENYLRVGREELSDLKALCAGCHESVEQSKHDPEFGPMSFHPRQVFIGWPVREYPCDRCGEIVTVSHLGSRDLPPVLDLSPAECWEDFQHTEADILGVYPWLG